MSASEEQQPSPPKRGWFSRNALWFIPTILFMPPLLCVGCCGGLGLLGMNALKSTEPYKMAMARIQADPQVIEALGEPIEADTWNFQGGVNQTTERATADYTFGIHGPQGTANVHFEAVDEHGWEFEILDVTLPDGGTISLSD